MTFETYSNLCFKIKNKSTVICLYSFYRREASIDNSVQAEMFYITAPTFLGGFDLKIDRVGYFSPEASFSLAPRAL